MPDHVYVYPAYLTQTLSRRSGRRVPASQAVAEVTAEEIVEAARRLGHTATLESEKQYPRQFFSYAGRVKVAKKAGVTKAKLLKALATELRRSRPAGGKH